MSVSSQLDRDLRRLRESDPSAYESYDKAIRFWMTHGDLPPLVAAGNNAAHFLYSDQKGVPHEPSDDPSPHNHFAAQSIMGLYERNRGKQLLCVNGTARDAALTEQANEFLRDLSKALVAQGVGHICGGAISGAMGSAIKNWARAIDLEANSIREGMPAVEITTVLLKLFGHAATREAPFDVSNYGSSSPKQLTWLTRVPALHGIGSQDSMLFWKGGLGTLLELLYPLCASRHTSVGLAGIYDDFRPPSAFYCISEERDHFWGPMANLSHRLSSTGRSSPESASNDLLLFQSHESGVIDHIVAEFKSGKRRSRERPRLPEEQVEAAKRALGLLNLGGLHPRHNPSNSNFITIMDNTIAAHQILLHLRSYVNIFAQEGADAAENYLEDSISAAASERDRCMKVLAKLAHKPAVRLVGSTQDDVWNRALEEYSQEIINSAVSLGYSLVIDGLGTEGMAKRWSNMWVVAKRAFARRNGRESTSELVRVQVSFEDRESPPRSLLYGYEEIVLPTVANFETRNELAACIGSKQLIIVAPGGQTASFTAAQALLNMQLQKLMHTPYSQMPAIQILNVSLDGKAPGFYSDLLEQLEVMEKHQTISSGDYNPKCFVSLKRPRADASEILRYLVS